MLMGAGLTDAVGAMTLTVLMGLGGLQAPAAQQPSVVKSRTEKGLYQLKIVEPGFDVTVTETERRPQSSVLEMKGVVPTVTADGTTLFRAIYDIAKERGVEHIFTVPIPRGSRPPRLPRQADGWHLNDVMTVYMFKDPKTPLKELLGADYSAEAQDLFDKLGYVSIANMAMLFGGK